MALTNGALTRKAVKLNGTYGLVYTCPVARVAKVDSILISNLHASYDMAVYLGVEISGVIYDWVSGVRLCGSTWEPGGRMPLILPVKQTLEAGDLLKGKIAAIGQPSWNATSYDAAIYLSIIEFTI